MIDYSRCGESSLLWNVFEKIGTKQKYGVEFGASDGYSASNLRMFLMNGWTGLQLDSNPANEVKQEFITKDNINKVFKKYEVPEDLDLISIDIDGNDYWVWKELDYHPSVIIIEFNSNFKYGDKVVLEYVENHVWDGSHAYSASLSALEELGKSKGYFLYMQTTDNLIFISNEYSHLIQTTFDATKVNLPIPSHFATTNKKFIYL